MCALNVLLPHTSSFPPLKQQQLLPREDPWGFSDGGRDEKTEIPAKFILSLVETFKITLQPPGRNGKALNSRSCKGSLINGQGPEEGELVIGHPDVCLP